MPYTVNPVTSSPRCRCFSAVWRPFVPVEKTKLHTKQIFQLPVAEPQVQMLVNLSRTLLYDAILVCHLDDVGVRRSTEITGGLQTRRAEI